MIETGGDVEWQSPIQDGTSNMTGSTVFDLDGDGDYEVIYRDETHFRVFRGSDGDVLFEDALSSFTANEGVVVADVDRDGRAEIVVSSDRAIDVSGIPQRTYGLRVYGDANDNWIGCRPIWNQHAYHSGNVRDDGTVPPQMAPSWLDHNTFRANVAPEGGVFDAADLSASRV
ncbi:MAG: VCBS repeat-containing protein, partial [Phycisphaeraceae bacterium]|nr:VCBS repeat-containing protein [Phycisphaeraceae bacterium]